MTLEEFEIMNTIKEYLKELNVYHEDNIILIGGIATMLHTQKLEHVYNDFSHDADFFISRSDFSVLREYETTVKNARLSKYEIISKPYPIDVYVENEARLAVSFEDLLSTSVVIDGIRVASPANLLILKIDAAIGREGSSKGDKDDRDIIQLLELNHDEINPLYLTEERIDKLKRVVNSIKPYKTITNNNNYIASKIKKKCNESLNEILGVSKTKGNCHGR